MAMSIGFSEDSRRHSRFMDIYDEPMEDFSPLEGYKNMPEVTLREAVRPVDHLFEDIYEYVYIAEEVCQNPRDDLTPDESASIYLYTMEFRSKPSFYVVFNEILRNVNHRDIKPWFLYLKLFFTATDKLQSHNKQLWRGVSGTDLQSKYHIGQILTWWGISSCSEQLSIILDKFLSRTGVRTAFDIQCLYAKNIASHSSFPDEKEFILMPGSKFKIIDIASPADGLHIIKLEQIRTTSNQKYVNATVITLPNYNTPLPTVGSNVVQTSSPEPLSVKDLPSVPQTNVNSASTSFHNSNEPTVTIETKHIQQPVDDARPKSKRIHKAFTIFLFFLTFFPVAALVIGQLYKNDCPIQPWIPQWLWIFGATGLGSFGVLACLGSIWLFPHHSTVQFDKNNSTNYCEKTVYNFTFGTLIGMYSLGGLMLCCCTLICYFIR